MSDYIHINRSSGYYCSCRNWQDMYWISKFKLKCPNCGKIEIIKPSLFDLIKLIRKGRKLSKAELARRTGLSVSTITRLENRETCGNRKTIEKLIEVLEANKKLVLSNWNIARLLNDKRLKNYGNLDYILSKES